MTGWIPNLIRMGLTLLGVTALTFFLLKAVPGDPALGLLGQRASPQALEQIREALGEGQPLLKQYLGYLGLLLQGELGRSYYTQRPVAQDLLEKFPNTFYLATAALLWALGVALVLGTLATVYAGTWVDRLISGLARMALSIPVFWLGLVLILLFSLTWHLLPPAGMGHGDLAHLILPALTLGTASAATLIRVVRTALAEVLTQPYIQAARARGLSPWRVILLHAWRNAALPVVVLTGLDFASYLNGAVLTESIFGWDGVGRYALEGILRRDVPVVLGVVLLGAVVFVTLNALVDLLHRILNPRLREALLEGRRR